MLAQHQLDQTLQPLLCLILTNKERCYPQMKIALTGASGGYALIDAEDYEVLSQSKWYLDKNGYAARGRGNGTTYMHRLVMNTPQGMFTDHINHNRADNQKSNLRIVTHQENMLNMSPGLYGYGWVSEVKRSGSTYFVGRIKRNKVTHETVTCKTEEQARGALKQMLKQLNLQRG